MKKLSKEKQTLFIAGLSDKEPQIFKGILRVTVALESDGRTPIALTTSRVVFLSSDTTIETPLHLATDAIDSWTEILPITEYTLNKNTATVFYKHSKKKSKKSLNISTTNLSSKRGKRS